MSKTNVYILRLSSGRYYIGKSDNVLNRYAQHLNGTGSAWTRMYKPISLFKTIENVSSFEEDKVTKMYMSKYGIDKVRGGSYVQVDLAEFQKAALNREIWCAQGLCTRCGRPGHFVKDCYAKTDVLGNIIDMNSDYSDTWSCEYCYRTFTTAFSCRVHEKSCVGKNVKSRRSKPKEDRCYRCGRPGHYLYDCDAVTHRKGHTLDSDCESDYYSD
jgi:predicted GIY-YIG superfamily endonuclease